MANSQLCGPVSLTYQNLKTFAPHINPGQAFKDGKFEDAFNMENALMQQPSHILYIGLIDMKDCL